MTQWVSQNATVVVLLFGVLFAGVVALGGIVVKREVGRLDALHVKVDQIRVTLAEHIAREEAHLGKLDTVVADVAELRRRIPPDGELRSVLGQLQALVLKLNGGVR